MRDGMGGCGVVAGEHDRLHAARVQRRDGFACVRFDGVGHGEHRHKGAIDGGQYRRGALGGEPFHDPTCIVDLLRGYGAVEQRGIAHTHGMALHGGPHALSRHTGEYAGVGQVKAPVAGGFHDRLATRHCPHARYGPARWPARPVPAHW